jgi:hypothetical protein
LQGRCGWSWSSVKATHGSWIAEKKLNILVQLALHKHPDLPDVPLITDLATTDKQRQVLRLIFARQVMGRPFLAPPGIPAERAAALRTAFMETMKDPAFIADAEKSQLEVNPVAGEELQKLVADIYKTPPEIAKQAAHRWRRSNSSSFRVAPATNPESPPCRPHQLDPGPARRCAPE